MKFESKNLNAIHDILNENVNDKQTVYSEGPTPLTTEQKREFHEAVKTFSQMGESVYGITEALKQFQKSANEVLIHERRMEAAFEDIAHGVGNYFEVG